MDFDPTKARFQGPEANGFKPFRVPDTPIPLEKAGFKPDEPLLIVERGGEKRALSLRQMTFHHIAQGTLAGEPYVVSF